MQATLLAVRAIGAEFARGLWVQCLVGTLAISIPVIALLVWLISMSAWWWLLAAPIGIVFSVAIALLVVASLFIRYVRPAQGYHQKKQVKAFVRKLQFVSEVTSTPKAIILFRVVRSLAASGSDTYLQRLFQARELQKDFSTIRSSFKSRP